MFTMAYGLPLSGEKDEGFLSTLNAVEETLCRHLRTCKSSVAKKTMIEGIYWNLDRLSKS